MGSMGSDSIENNEKCTALSLARPYPGLTSRWNGRPTADVFSPSPVASCVGRRSLRSFDDPQSSKLNPPHRVFDDMPTSALHCALKQDVTVFPLVMGTIRHFSWALLCSTTLSPMIPARTMLDDTASSKPVGDNVRRLGVVEYYVRHSVALNVRRQEQQWT